MKTLDEPPKADDYIGKKRDYVQNRKHSDLIKYLGTYNRLMVHNRIEHYYTMRTLIEIELLQRLKRGTHVSLKIMQGSI
jgi:hypothetical protein